MEKKLKPDSQSIVNHNVHGGHRERNLYFVSLRTSANSAFNSCALGVFSEFSVSSVVNFSGKSSWLEWFFKPKEA